MQFIGYITEIEFRYALSYVFLSSGLFLFIKPGNFFLEKIFSELDIHTGNQTACERGYSA